jgi:peptide/nickel transport system substrate-binding protein
MGDGKTAGIWRTDGSPVRRLCRRTAPIAALAVALAAACGPGDPPVRAEVVLSVGYAAPAQAGVAAGLGTLIDQLTTEGLVRTGPDGHVEPMLADRWKIDDAGTTVTLYLRQNVSFHDGSPMTAQDVTTSLNRLRESPGRIAQNPVLGDIESIEAPERYRVVIKLDRPAAQLLLFELGVRVEKLGPDGQRIATGPFSVESVTPEETTLRVNPHYHRGRPEIDRVSIKTYPTLRTAWVAMMRSEIDFLFNVPIEAREFVEADPSVRVFSRNTPYAYALLFNTRRPPFDDARVRVALSRAVDRDAIIDGTFRSHSSVASGIWPAHWAFDGVELTYDYDPRGAHRELNALGLEYPMRANGGATEGFAHRLRFKALVSTDLARIEPIALLVQQQLRQIGVEMEIDAKPFGEIGLQVRQSQGDSWDAVLLPLNTARNLGRLYIYWHSSQELDVSGFNGADDILESLRSSVTEADASASATEFQRVLFEAAPAVFLAGLEEARAVSLRFVVPDEPGRDVIETLWQWRVADGATAN